MKRVDDISKIYTISSSTNDSLVGLIALIIIGIISVIYLSLFIFIFIGKYKNHFKFFSKDLWFMIFTGIFIILYINLLEYGELTPLKCNLKIGLFFVGTSFIFIPIIYSLIVNFPEKSKKVDWVINNKYKFILTLFGIELILIFLSFIFFIYN